MASRSGEEIGSAVLATASPAEITGNSNRVDFEKLLAEFVRGFHPHIC